MSNDALYNQVDIFCNAAIKLAFIKKLPNGKYRVMSEKGKNLGTYDSKSEAKKRLQQVEYFKHVKTSDNSVDLSKLDKITYSAVMREFVKKLDQEEWLKFVKIYKDNFDKLVLSGKEDFEEKCLMMSLKRFNDHIELKLPGMSKEASINELGSPDLIGKYLADIIKFTLMKISPKNRHKAISSVGNKVYNLNAVELFTKKMPASASMGQAITFVKHVLFGHDPAYIKQVLTFIYKSLA